MDANEFIGLLIWELHGGFRAEVEPLTQEQFLLRPVPDANSIAFLLWHFTCMEDGVVHRQFGGKPSVWQSESWHEKLGLQESDMGTGFTSEQVGAFQPAKEDVLAYCERVWEAVPEVLATVTADDLSVAANPERPRATAGRSLASFVIGHGFWHLGDIRFIKGLQGMPFAR